MRHGGREEVRCCGERGRKMRTSRNNSESAGPTRQGPRSFRSARPWHVTWGRDTGNMTRGTCGKRGACACGPVSREAEGPAAGAEEGARGRGGGMRGPGARGAGSALRAFLRGEQAGPFNTRNRPARKSRSRPAGRRACGAEGGCGRRAGSRGGGSGAKETAAAKEARRRRRARAAKPCPAQGRCTGRHSGTAGRNSGPR